MKLNQKIEIVQDFKKRSFEIQYDERVQLQKLLDDIHLFMERTYKEDSTFWQSFHSLKFSPDGIIANTNNIIMTNAWKDGISSLNRLINSFETDLKIYKGKSSFSEDTHVGIKWFFRKLTLKSWIAIISISLSCVGIGINLTRIGIVREYFQIKVEPKIVIKKVEVPVANPKLDGEINELIDFYKARLDKLQKAYLNAEDSAANHIGSYDYDRYKNAAIRIQGQIKTENQFFSDQFDKLNALNQ